jgi:adenosylcobinamide-phosphate synthase
VELHSWLGNICRTPTALVCGIWLACLLDAFFGDPRSIPHPVVFIARLADRLENWSRKLINYEFYAGFFTTVLTLLGVLSICLLSFTVLSLISPLLSFFVAVFLIYTSLALRGLITHCMAVYTALMAGLADNDLSSARKQLSMIVGRETEQLDRDGIVCACVETAAENMSDGVVAPFCFAAMTGFAALLIGWAELSLPVAATAAMLYKAVNTMDSMFGYKNDKYILFGRFPARLDDVLNWLPARISALMIVAAAFVCRKNGVLAWKILVRDRKKHSSPNAGYPEAAMAGALGLKLGGSSYYFGKLIVKPTIGEPVNIPENFHIVHAVKVMTVGSIVVCLCLPVILFVLFA